MYKQLSSAAVMIAAMLAISSTAPVAVSSAQAHVPKRLTPGCAGTVEGRTGVGVRKSKAKKRARRKWKYDVKRKYRRDALANWDHALDRHYHCRKKHGTWRCRAVGVACQPV